MTREVHVFDNDVRVFDDQLVAGQKDRYLIRNVHESDEEDIFIELIRAIPAGGCFVNIGAAIGYYPLLARKIAPHLIIHAVEPLGRFRGYFRENMTLNGVGPTDFTIHTEAISYREGDQRFVDNGYSSVLFEVRRRMENASATAAVKSTVKVLLNRAGLRKLDSQESTTVITIQTITLDHLLTSVGTVVDLLQMDVQGAEAEILQGALNSLRSGSIRTFLIGTHSQALHQACSAVLRRHGYEIEYQEPHPRGQPDGIIVASRGARKLNVPSGRA
jgi:FkbM family methyltransferase